MAAQTPDFRHQTSDTRQSEDNSDFSRIENTLKKVFYIHISQFFAKFNL
jgi:hypothetical protein